MFANKTFRLSALLLAVGLLLGLAATGCSDKDRNGGLSEKTFTYTYDKALEKLPVDAKYVTAFAFDKNDQMLPDANIILDSGEITADASGNCATDTTITSEVYSVAYVFYHEQTDEGVTVNVYDGMDYLEVGDIDDGEIVPRTDANEVKLSMKGYKVDSQGTETEIDPETNPVQVNDTVAVEALATCDNFGTEKTADISDIVGIDNDDDEEAILRESNSKLTYTAVGTGTVKFGLYYGTDANAIFYPTELLTITVAE